MAVVSRTLSIMIDQSYRKSLPDWTWTAHLLWRLPIMVPITNPSVFIVAMRSLMIQRNLRTITWSAVSVSLQRSLSYLGRKEHQFLSLLIARTFPDYGQPVLLATGNICLINSVQVCKLSGHGYSLFILFFIHFTASLVIWVYDNQFIAKWWHSQHCLVFIQPIVITYLIPPPSSATFYCPLLRVANTL